jgi:hypothetical protein
MGRVACMEEMRNALNIVIRKREWKIHLGRLRHRWKDYMKIKFRNECCQGQERIKLSLDEAQ